ncbi:MAG: T9SS type A sorting domain-containing protein [Candidatus Zixiibacteriota bacterium]
MEVRILKISILSFLIVLVCFKALPSLGFDLPLSPPIPEEKPGDADFTHNGNQEVPPQDTIVAALVKSWAKAWGYWDYLVWEDLNQNWSQYGATPIFIDTTLLNKESLSHQDLTDIGADVLIISGPSGAWKRFSQEEIEAVRDYAEGGHNVLGTYTVLFYAYGDTTVDNRGLASIFGLDSTLAYSLRDFDRRYHFNQGEYVFEGMESPYRSEGYNLSQQPDKGFWTGADLRGARVAAATLDDTLGIVTFYPAGSYAAFYISSMPEYEGGETDKQFLYNAISYQGPTDVDEPENSVFPREFALLQNYPNPFNLLTIFEYHLPRDCEVTLEVFNLLGQKVAVLVNARQAAGHKAVGWRNGSLASGTYFYQLRAGSYLSVKPMVILK